MFKDLLIKYLENPDTLDSSSLQRIKDWIAVYPFFQTVHLLHIKNIQNLDGQVGKDVLHQTAAFVTDRKILYYLLHKLPGPEKKNKPIPAGFEPVRYSKDIKNSLKENIASTITQQRQIYDLNTDDGIELIPGLAIDIRKEYGKDIELEDLDFSLHEAENKAGEEVFEITIGDEDPIAGMHISLPDVTIEQPSEMEESIELLFDDEVLVPEDRLTEQSKIPLEDGPAPEIQFDILNGNEKERNEKLIDKFIQSNPKIVPVEKPLENVDISAESVKEHESFFTDTLAKIYVKQGNYAKAILAYEKLSLKYPEKSAYFAGQISEIKKLINKT